MEAELERVKGIEPSYAAWEAAVLPLNYTRVVNLRARIVLDLPRFAALLNSPDIVITLKVNGESRPFPAPLSVAALLATLELAGKRVAVEKNGEIVPKSQHAQVMAADGDCFEIVVAVGGG